MHLKALRNRNRNRDKEFRERNKTDDDWNLVDRSNELAGEVGELCNLTKKVRRAKMGLYDSDVSKQEIKDEIADILICLDLLAMDMDIDLSEAVVEKFNKSSEKFGLETKF